MKFRNGVVTLIVSIGICGFANANEIYKWTDDDGNVHYTDTPVSEPSQLVNIQSRPTNAKQVAQQTAAVQTQQETSAERKEARAEAETERLQVAAQTQDRAEKCNMYKQRLSRFVQSRRLYKEDENGERVYLDDGETQAAREKTQQQVQEFCN